MPAFSQKWSKIFVKTYRPATRHVDCIPLSVKNLISQQHRGGVALKKSYSSKEMAMIYDYNQRLENTTQKRLREHQELKHFFRRFCLILLLAVAAMTLLILTFSPGTLENGLGPALQHAGQGIAAAKPVVKHAVQGAAKSVTPAIQQLISSASAAIGQ